MKCGFGGSITKEVVSEQKGMWGMRVLRVRPRIHEFRNVQSPATSGSEMEGSIGLRHQRDAGQSSTPGPKSAV
jgi:hypothetical protein